MSTLDPAIIRAFLQSNFDERANAVALVGAGMFSCAYSFVVGGRAYVLRVNAYLEDFQKDAFAREHFVSPALPIPKIVRIDKFDDTRYFCVTEHCAGKMLHDTNNADDLRIASQLFETLDAIHRIDVSRSRGWGLADANGDGRFDSWAESLMSLYNQKCDYDWAALARQPFFDKNLFDEFFQEMQRLLPYCPSDRYLIHRDYGFDNVVSDRTRITGVLDWAEFGYGDFLYDLAYLDYFSQHIPYGALWRERAAVQGRDVPHYEERLCCYMLDIGLHDMAIAATCGKKRAYTRARERTRSVLLPGRRAPTDWTQ